MDHHGITWHWYGCLLFIRFFACRGVGGWWSFSHGVSDPKSWWLDRSGIHQNLLQYGLHVRTRPAHAFCSRQFNPYMWHSQPHLLSLPRAPHQCLAKLAASFLTVQVQTISLNSQLAHHSEIIPNPCYNGTTDHPRSQPNPFPLPKPKSNLPQNDYKSENILSYPFPIFLPPSQSWKRQKV